MGFKFYCFDSKLTYVWFELIISLKTYKNKKTTRTIYKHAKNVS